MVASFSLGSDRLEAGRALTELLRLHPDVALRVRIRVTLDVLWELVQKGGGACEARRASSRLRVEHVEITAAGLARLVGEGDDSGAALLAWEIVVGRAAHRDDAFASVKARSGLARDRVDVCALLERALDGSGRIARIEALFDELSRGTVGNVASYDEVRAAFQLDELRRAAVAAAADSFANARRLAAAAGASAASPDDRQAAAWRSLAMQAAAKGGRRANAGGDNRLKSSGIRRTSPGVGPQLGAPPPAVPAPPSSSPGLGGTPAGTRMAIVLVHSVEAERQRLAAALRDAGHRVAEFTDADLALSASLAMPPLAIVADQELRDKTGCELARTVRAQAGSLAATPIVLLVPQARTRARNSSFATGPDARLFKPLKPEVLVAELGRVLALAPRLRTARAGLGSLEGSADSLLKGDLRMMPLGGLLAMLEIERRTGLIRVSTMRGTVGLELASGCVLRGSFQGEMVAPLEAMRALVNVREGPFSFQALTPRQPPRDGPPIHRLLSAASRFQRDSSIDTDEA